MTLGVIATTGLACCMLRRFPVPDLSLNGALFRLINAAGVVALAAAAVLVPVGRIGAETARPLRILALGDSLVAGYGLSAAESFPAQLEEALRRRGQAVRVLDAGVSGDTTAGGLARLDWALGEDPDLVLVELGANDALRGIDPARVRANLREILERLRRRNLPTLLAGMMAPRNLGRAYVQAFDRIYPELAAEFGIPLYPFFLEGVAGDPALNLSDGVHPNAAGVAVIVERILPHVEALIAAQGPARPATE